MEKTRPLHAALIACALLVGVFLRANGIRDGLWLDEIGTAWAARGSAGEVVAHVSAVHGQSPLYYLIIHAATAIFGESEVVLRLPSVVFAAIGQLLACAACTRAFGRRAGIVAAVLVALDPVLVRNERDARPYALAEACAFLAALGLARALETGKARDRALAWGGAVLAVYAHSIFVPILPAMAIAPLLARREKRAYGIAKVALDAAVAGALLVPELVHMARIFGRRSELAWVGGDEHYLGRLVPNEVRWALALSLVAFLLVSFLPSVRRRGRKLVKERGFLAFLILVIAVPVALLLALLALSTNIVAVRYMTLATIGALLLIPGLILVLPRPLAAIAASVVACSFVGDLPHRRSASWREIDEKLDAIALPQEPILLESSFVEANLLATPGRVEAELRSFLVSPLAVRPGKPLVEDRFLLLPSRWDTPGMEAYLEREVAPVLEKSRSFSVVLHKAPVDKAGTSDLARWLERRFPGKFACTHPGDPGDTVVARYDARP